MSDASAEEHVGWKMSRTDGESYICLGEGSYHVVYLYPPEGERIPIISDDPRRDARRVLDAINAAAAKARRAAFEEAAETVANPLAALLPPKDVADAIRALATDDTQPKEKTCDE